MNQDIANAEDWERQIDRLVDGELHGREYRDLLTSLDGREDGWKRVALSFLEDRAWQLEFQEVRGEADIPADATQAAVIAEKSAKDSRWAWSHALSVAASFAIAFLLGVVVRHGLRSGDVSPDSSPMVATESIDGSSGRDERLVAVPAEKAPANNRSAPVNRPDDAEKVTVLVRHHDQQAPERLELPLVAGDREHAWRLSQPPMRVPPEIQQLLQRSGRQMRWHREFMHMETDDGRRVVVPVDQLEVVPVKRTYQ